MTHHFRGVLTTCSVCLQAIGYDMVRATQHVFFSTLTGSQAPCKCSPANSVSSSPQGGEAALQDYTLIHYDVAAWEGKAYAYGLKYLQDVGCPVGGLTFDPNLVIRGLIVDKELGNLVKVDRFG